MENIRFFLSENLHILVVKYSVYLNRHVFVMVNSAYDRSGRRFVAQGLLSSFHRLDIT